MEFHSQLLPAWSSSSLLRRPNRSVGWRRFKVTCHLSEGGRPQKEWAAAAMVGVYSRRLALSPWLSLALVPECDRHCPAQASKAEGAKLAGRASVRKSIPMRKPRQRLYGPFPLSSVIVTTVTVRRPLFSVDSRAPMHFAGA